MDPVGHVVLEQLFPPDMDTVEQLNTADRAGSHSSAGTVMPLSSAPLSSDRVYNLDIKCIV